MEAKNTETIPHRQRKRFRLLHRVIADRIPHMTETFHNRLHRLLAESPKAPSAISKEAGLNKETLRKLLSEPTQNPSMKTAKGLARVLGVTVEYLLNGEGARVHEPLVGSYDPDTQDDFSDEAMSLGTATGLRNVPEGHSPQIDVTGGMGGGGLTTVMESVTTNQGLTFSADHVKDHWRLPPEVLASLSLKASSITIIPVQGDSMLPTLNEGDYVFVDTRHRFPSPDGIYAIADAFGGIIVKRLEVVSGPGDQDPMVSVISDNHERHSSRLWRLEDLNIIGRVVRRFGVVR